jgi:hypothetical protein
MKCRRWSSLGISVCSALALAAPAVAAVEVSPQRIDPGQTARLFFWLANDGDVPITSVAIGIPTDFRLGEVESKGSWKTAIHTRTASWDDGRIAPGEFAFFSVTVKAPAVEERAVFSILAGRSTGRTVTYQAQVNVVAARPTRDQPARLIATIALIVAIVAAIVALAGGILALWLWLRPRPPDAF